MLRNPGLNRGRIRTDATGYPNLEATRRHISNWDKPVRARVSKRFANTTRLIVNPFVWWRRNFELNR
jgi:hypothetical protein